jgi:hypothetical protein
MGKSLSQSMQMQLFEVSNKSSKWNSKCSWTSFLKSNF